MAHASSYAAASLCLLLWYSGAQPSIRPSESDAADVARVPNATVVQDTLQPNGTVVWVFRFHALAPARIAVRTRAAAEVQCRLSDGTGQMVPTIPSRGYACRFAWLPQRTGAHRMEISNHGDGLVPYDISVSR